MSRNLERSEWREYICDDLWPVLRWLDERHGVHIAEVVFDMKGAYTYVYVDGPLTSELAEEAAREFSSNAELRIGEGWFGCARDYSSVETLTRGEGAKAPGKTVMDRLRDFFK
jgi:hypothetical protein